MHRNRVVLASIASLAFGILCETAETCSACDLCHSRVTTFYRPSLWGVNTYPRYFVGYGGSCSTTDCLPGCPTVSCRPICQEPCRPICQEPCRPNCAPSDCEPACAPVSTYQSRLFYGPRGCATGQCGVTSRPSPARTASSQRPSAAVAHSRGEATQMVKSAPKPSLARVVQQAPARAPLATVRTATISQPTGLNSGWTAVPAPKLASNR